MILQGITIHDLVSAYVERTYRNLAVLVIYLNDSDGCKSVLEDVQYQLQLPAPPRMLDGRDCLFVASSYRELDEFLKKHPQLVYDTHMELYSEGSMLRHN